MISLATLGLYALLAPAHVVFGDNAEFAALGALGGAAHPSGYPLFVLWLRAWSWLPVESPAHAAAIATAILGALQVLVLHAACRAWGARPIAATIAVGLYAAGPIAMRVHTEAEVFALNGLICASVLLIAATNGPLCGLRRIVALGLIAGLGLSDHLTCVLVAPVGLLGVVRGIREAQVSRLAAVCIATLALGAGLVPYLYLLITPETPVSWGEIRDLPGLFRHFIRADYGGVGQLSPRGVNVAASEQLLALGHSIGRTYLWLPCAIGISALGYFAIRRERTESRVAWAMLSACWLLAGPVLVSRFNIVPVHLGLYTVQRFHLLPLLLLAVPTAVGLSQIGARVVQRWPARIREFSALHTILAVLGFLSLAATSLPRLARVHSRAMQQGLENMLQTLPQDAVVIGSTDEFLFGLGYLQGALGKRSDVTIIAIMQLGLPHYRERIRRKTGIVVERVAPGSDEKLSVVVAEQIIATGRPLFIDPYQANIAASFPSYPYGLVFRILPRGQAPPPAGHVFAINKALYEQYRFGYPTPGPNDEIASQFHRHYARAWTIIAKAVGHAGLPDEQAFALELAATLAPWASP